MNDAIDRKDAIGAILSVEHIAELRDGDAVIRVSAVNYVLRNLPSAQPEQQWIPVSERLPKVGRNVLLSVGKGLYTAEGELKHDGTWVQYRWSANIENVDAWAEMPEPWRGEEDK